MALRDLLEEKGGREAAAAGDHGIDGGAGGSGLITADPTQGPGTTAWQQSQRMAAEINARRRRN